MPQFACFRKATQDLMGQIVFRRVGYHKSARGGISNRGLATTAPARISICGPLRWQRPFDPLARRPTLSVVVTRMRTGRSELGGLQQASAPLPDASGSRVSAPHPPRRKGSLMLCERVEPEIDVPACTRDLVRAVLRIPELQRMARSVAASWHASPPILQARHWHRVKYGHPVLLRPLDAPPVDGRSLLVSGRDISLGGFSFAHADPLACRRAAVTFLLDGKSRLPIEIRLTWCRFTREGIYQSGGTFVRPLETEAADRETGSALRETLAV